MTRRSSEDRDALLACYDFPAILARRGGKADCDR
jgi:hypothetical protein